MAARGPLKRKKQKFFCRYLYRMRLSLILIFCFLPFLLSAQLLPDPIGLPDISGVWVGELFQDEGGVADRFAFSVQINQDGLALSGTSYVRHEDIFVEMTFTGYRMPNGVWRIEESNIVRGEKPQDLSWCMKILELRLSYERQGMELRGPWYGDSAFGPCVPGTIRLRKRPGQV